MRHWLWIGAIAAAAAMFGGTTGQVREAQAQGGGGSKRLCNHKTCVDLDFDTCNGPTNPVKNCTLIQKWDLTTGTLLSSTCNMKDCQ